ncbi:MAG TPA: AAA family ATPase [Nocardioidaceae bacterium]|nr:AAA family ATPase [Nocardioidaceae bacterium]
MDLLVIFGPPAVGKMTVGREVARLTGYKLFHNHMTVEPVLELFEFGSPPFTRLVSEFRTRVIEEAAESDLPGMVFTFVWALDDPGDQVLVDGYVDIVESRGGTVRYVELYATQEERLARNATPERLDAKRSKRDVEASNGWLRDADEQRVLNTGAGFDLMELTGGRPHVRIDNTSLTPEKVAARVVAALDLPRAQRV